MSLKRIEICFTEKFGRSFIGKQSNIGKIRKTLREMILAINSSLTYSYEGCWLFFPKEIESE